ncbi:MAG: hypothetical protein ACKOXH_04980 [Aquirufa sp.]
MKKLLILCLFPLISFAQAPIPAEVMFGNNRTNFLMILNRPVDAKGRFHFFNVTVGAANYQNTPSETEIVVNNSLTYALGHNFHATAGAQWHFKLGFVPTVGVEYLKARPDFLLVIFPTFNMLPNRNLETVGILEYKPALSPKTRLYTRLQAMYNQDMTLEAHARSAYSVRAGISIKQFTVGLGSNLDYYGPMKFDKTNHGLFVQVRL